MEITFESLGKKISDILEQLNQTTETEDKMNIESLVIEYNIKQNKVFGLYSDPKYSLTYSTEHLAKMKADEHSKIIESFKLQAKELVDRSGADLKRELQRKNSKQFPLKFSEDIQKNILGELRCQRAFNFLSITTDHALIEKEIKSAMAVGDIDTFSYMIERSLMKEPTDGINTKDRVQFYKFIHQSAIDFYDREGIGKIDEEIKETKTLNREATGFLNGLNDGLTSYYTKSMVENKNPKDLVPVMDSIDKSMKYWQYEKADH
jgi:hypothetical protein